MMQNETANATAKSPRPRVETLMFTYRVDKQDIQLAQNLGPNTLARILDSETCGSVGLGLTFRVRDEIEQRLHAAGCPESETRDLWEEHTQAVRRQFAAEAA